MKVDKLHIRSRFKNLENVKVDFDEDLCFDDTEMHATAAWEEPPPVCPRRNAAGGVPHCCRLKLTQLLAFWLMASQASQSPNLLAPRLVGCSRRAHLAWLLS